MNRRKLTTVFVGVALSGAWSDASGQTLGASDSSHTEWVERRIEETRRLKPGMTRSQLLELFTTEGGLSNPWRRTYVSRHCPYIKVDVTFRAVGIPFKERRFDANMRENPIDEITSISRPYLALGVMD